MVISYMFFADTTRLVRPGEVNGHDYHFVSREEFERDIEQDRFLEYGEQKGHFHGTSFSAIKTIMESGRVPVLDLHPQVNRREGGREGGEGRGGEGRVF